MHCLTLEDGTDRLSRTSVRNYDSTLRRIPKERRSQVTPWRKTEIMYNSFSSYYSMTKRNFQHDKPMSPAIQFTDDNIINVCVSSYYSKMIKIITRCMYLSSNYSKKFKSINSTYLGISSHKSKLIICYTLCICMSRHTVQT